MKTTLWNTQNDLPEKLRVEAVGMLNQQLADALDLHLQAKQAHWNVKGPSFIALHELFDEVVEEFEEYADEIAERAVVLGGTAYGTVRVAAGRSRLPNIRSTSFRGVTTSSRCPARLRSSASRRGPQSTLLRSSGMPTPPICSPRYRAAWTSCCGRWKRTRRGRIDHGSQSESRCHHVS